MGERLGELDREPTVGPEHPGARVQAVARESRGRVNGQSFPCQSGRRVPGGPPPAWSTQPAGSLELTAPLSHGERTSPDAQHGRVFAGWPSRIPREHALHDAGSCRFDSSFHECHSGGQTASAAIGDRCLAEEPGRLRATAASHGLRALWGHGGMPQARLVPEKVNQGHTGRGPVRSTVWCCLANARVNGRSAVKCRATNRPGRPRST